MSSSTMAGLKSSRQRKTGQGFQLPSHVQTSLNKEERLLQRNLMDLEKKMKHEMRCIIQDQQVAGTKLRSLQTRLLASQRKFHALIHPPSPQRESEDDAFEHAGSPVSEEISDGKRSRKASIQPAGMGQDGEPKEISSRRGSKALRSSLRHGKRMSNRAGRQKTVVFT